MAAAAATAAAAKSCVDGITKMYNEKSGDLTSEEIDKIQEVVDEAERPLDVVGSAARGERGSSSDIDYVTNPQHLPNFEGKEGQLPSIDPEHGIIPGAHNPYQGPGIRFEPGAEPAFTPKQE